MKHKIQTAQLRSSINNNTQSSVKMGKIYLQPKTKNELPDKPL